MKWQFYSKYEQNMLEIFRFYVKIIYENGTGKVTDNVTNNF